MYTASPENNEDGVGIETDRIIVWNSREIANITWRPSSLIINGADVKLDASLLLYNDQTDEFEETVVLATDLPNTGYASIKLPDSEKFPPSTYNVYAAIVKLSVNMSTTTIPSIRRVSHLSGLMNILGIVKKFTKVRFISSITSSIKKRILCEVWFDATPRFPQQRIPPCPCNTMDAVRDDRFVEERYDNEYLNAAAGLLRRYVLHQGSRTCYQQANVRYE